MTRRNNSLEPTHARRAAAWIAGLVCLCAAFAAQAVTPERPSLNPLHEIGPVAARFAVQPVADLARHDAPALDRAGALIEDERRDYDGLPPRFALAEDVRLSPETAGTWEAVGNDYQVWRLRITSPGALSLNLGFDRYRLPKNARLTIYPADATGGDDPRGVRVFNEWDNRPHHELWTPLVAAADIVVELLLPTVSRHDYELELTSINRGYRVFGTDPAASEADKSGSCNIDVVCPEGDEWRAEINAVGVYTVGGVWYCTGAVINTTAQDETPYFLTANHCGVTSANDQSVVVYWNFQSPTCGAHGGGSLTDFNSGVIHRVSSAASDVTLVEFEEPLDPAHEVSYAGWDRSGLNPVGAIAIHHPSTDEKSISFEFDPTSTTSYLGHTVPGDGTHLRVADWDLGTTEPGSSGSPLFDPDHRIIGQLHGGWAACGNDTSDYYGKLSVSWSSLQAYLDPLGTGATTVDTYAPWQTGIVVLGGDFATVGDVGGPFVPASQAYTIRNLDPDPVTVQVTADVGWLDIVGAGPVAPGGQIQVTVSVNAAANSLGSGSHAGLLTFTNLTTGEGDTTRDVTLQAGQPEPIYTWMLDADPGWTRGSGWQFGLPLGGGGAEHGNPDPASGYTGSYVYGFELAGDYPSNLPETHLTTAAIDCSALSAVSLKFRRWLNVEQSLYDHAYVRVSNDGVDWIDVWANGGAVEDAGWVPVEYDLGAVADGQPTVYVRWTMGTTDGSWEYSGWNIDDVEIWGLRDWISAVGDLPDRQPAVGNHPNPFNPSTRVSFTLAQDGSARLDVFDPQGRLVRRLVDGTFGAGPHTAVWDGRDDGGRRVGSGVYLARLVTAAGTVEHKMVMLK